MTTVKNPGIWGRERERPQVPRHAEPRKKEKLKGTRSVAVNRRIARFASQHGGSWGEQFLISRWRMGVFYAQRHHLLGDGQSGKKLPIPFARHCSGSGRYMLLWNRTWQTRKPHHDDKRCLLMEEHLAVADCRHGSSLRRGYLCIVSDAHSRSPALAAVG